MRGARRARTALALALALALAGCRWPWDELDPRRADASAMTDAATDVGDASDVADAELTCGVAGRVCCATPPPCRAGLSCVEGGCRCNPGFADCDDDPATGCETDTRVNTDHCGRCRERCTGMARTCVAGVCM